jgi:hypothetical protein
MIFYKWNTYAYILHYRGAAFHIIYLTTIVVYIYTTYLIGVFGQQENITFPIIMIFGIIYPFCYDSIQMYKSGLAYFEDTWNWIDLLF